MEKQIKWLYGEKRREAEEAAEAIWGEGIKKNDKGFAALPANKKKSLLCAHFHAAGRTTSHPTILNLHAK